MYQQTIPKDKRQSEEVIANLIAAGRQMQAPRAIKWWLAHWYLRGARNFTDLNYQTGSLQVAYTDESGVLNFQLDRILSKYQTQLGRLLALDLAPATKQKGISLQGMRKRGIAQAALNVAFPSDKVGKLLQDLLPTVLIYGMAGLMVWIEDEDSMGIEVVMPWELLPIPPHVASAGDVRGIIRFRTVPLTWVQDLMITPSRQAAVYKEIPTVEVATGQIPSRAHNRFQGSISPGGSNAFSVSFNNYPSGGKGVGKKTDKTHEKVTNFVEVWTWTPDDYLAEYIVFAGNEERYRQLYRTDYSQRKIHRPIRIVGDIQTGAFYPPSYVDTLIPINAELEYTIGRMFQNAQDWDLFGFLLEPSTAGIPAEAERGADGIKRLRYEVDWTSPQPISPQQVKPVSPGIFAAKILETGLKIMDDIANQPTELMAGDAPGRVDSSSGLGLLYELSRVPLSSVAKSIALGVSGCYKSMLGLIRGIWKEDKIIDMTMLDDTLAGIKFNANDGTITLAENALPHPDEIEITIKSDEPKSPEQQKMELNEALKAGIITPIEYRIEARKRGLDLPVGSDLEWQNYRRAMLENIVMFGDGTVPGQVIWSERDLHEVHLMVLDAFMARPEFYAASAAVRDKFAEHRAQHMTGLGQYPEQLPPPEESAQQTLDQMKMMSEMEGLPTAPTAPTESPVM